MAEQTRNRVALEQIEENRTREGAYTFNAPLADDFAGLAFTVACLRLGDHAHLEVQSGRATPQPAEARKPTRFIGARAGHLVLRWHEWEELRRILDRHDCFHIAEVERPRQGQIEFHGASPLAALEGRIAAVRVFAEHLVAFADSYGPRENNTAVQWAAREACRDHGSIVLELLAGEPSC